MREYPIIKDGKRSSSCTTIMIGRDATADASRIFGRTEDSEGLCVKRIVSQPAQKREGPWLYRDDTNGFSIDLPAQSCQYVSVPNALTLGEGLYEESVLNEYGVSMSATETIFANAQALAADPLVENGIAESSMPTVVIPYIRSAREGIERLGDIVTRFGSAESNGVVIADENEMWYMEIYTGHQWAAVRCPDDCYAVVANDGMIGDVDTSDAQNALASQDFWALAKKRGFYKEVDGKPHAAGSYCSAHRDYSQLRVWAAQRRFSPSQTGRYNVKKTYNLFMKPDRKLTIDDAMELTRYRYEDTPYNVNAHARLRAIGINRTAEAHLFWLRENKPEIMWVALANPEMSVYLPIYRNAASFPKAFGIDCKDYDPESAYYKFRRVSALAVQNRAGYGEIVRKHWRETERKLIAGIDRSDERYLSAGRSGETAGVMFAEIAKAALYDADELFTQTLTSMMEDSVQDGGSDVYGNTPPAVDEGTD